MGVRSVGVTSTKEKEPAERRQVVVGKKSWCIIQNVHVELKEFCLFLVLCCLYHRAMECLIRRFIYMDVL